MVKSKGKIAWSAIGDMSSHQKTYMAKRIRIVVVEGLQTPETPSKIVTNIVELRKVVTFMFW